MKDEAKNVIQEALKAHVNSLGFRWRIGALVRKHLDRADRDIERLVEQEVDAAMKEALK